MKAKHILTFLLLICIAALAMLVMSREPAYTPRQQSVGGEGFVVNNLTASVSQVNSSASVPENPINKLAADFKAWEDRIEAREQELLEKENILADRYNMWLYGLLILIGFLIFLMIVNYYLDWKHRHRRRLHKHHRIHRKEEYLNNR